MGGKVNVMLVHGAWADASCWRKVILQLQSRGIEVNATQIPLTSLADDIEVTRRRLSANPQPTVLVGHSYGGAVITGAAIGIAHVKALVYITAFGLDEGESLESLSARGAPSPGSASIRPDANGYLWIDRSTFHEAFAADATADEAFVMSVVQRPLGVASFTGKSGIPAWRGLPSWYLVCTHDQMIPPPAQTFLANRMKATQRQVASSHAPFMSNPDTVTDLIVEAVESVAR